MNEAEIGISRAEAVGRLMELQRIVAHAGEARMVKALEMAISNIWRRHRQSCRNLVRRRERSQERILLTDGKEEK